MVHRAPPKNILCFPESKRWDWQQTRLTRTLKKVAPNRTQGCKILKITILEQALSHLATALYCDRRFAWQWENTLSQHPDGVRVPAPGTTIFIYATNRQLRPHR